VLRLLRQMVADPAWRRPPHAPFEPRQLLAQTVRRLRRVARPGSLVLLLSDFAQWDEAVEKELALLGRQAQLALYFCYDPLEAELPRAGSYRLSDGEADLTIATDQAVLRAVYSERFLNHRRRVEEFCNHHRTPFVAVATDQDPLQALQRTIMTRSPRYAGP